jgi:hypothetical protein
MEFLKMDNFFSKHKDMIKLVIIVIACALIAYGAIYVTQKYDSPIEEYAEDLLEKHTGTKIDFSPGKESK